jgi:hypothetical protein
VNDLEKLKAYTKTLLFCYASYEERAAIWDRIAELEEIDGLPPTILSGTLDGFH